MKTIQYTEDLCSTHVPLTSCYKLPGEFKMLDGIINDMKRGGIDFALVEGDTPYEVSVWRTRKGYLVE